MSNDIRGLDRWEGETIDFNKRAGKLRMQAGSGIIDALEHWYAQWQTRKTEQSKKQFQLWRLRLHVKHNSNPEFLQELDEVFEINLCDEEIGKTFWHVPAVKEYTARRGFNWRKDSGEALRGGSLKNETLDET